MQADGTLFLFHLMLPDQEPFDWQVDHLSAFGDLSLTDVEVLMAVGTVLDVMRHDLIWHLDLAQR